MKKNIYLFIITFTCIISNAQVFVNQPFEYSKERNLLDNKFFHSNIKSNFWNDSIPTEKKYWQLKPLINTGLGFDIKNKKVLYDCILGLNNYIKIKNLNINLYPFFNFLKEDYFLNEIQNQKIIPNIGMKSKILNTKFILFDIVGNINYKPTNYLNLEFGRGKVFLGDGYRSLLLSDNAPFYTYFRGIVDIWKIKYFYQIAHINGNYELIPNKWTSKFLFTHYLSLNISSRLNFSMFETVVQPIFDSTGVNRGLEVSYLNPVIFWRSVEYNLGSPDNVLVGFSGHLRFFKTTIFYGQILIDEFILKYVRDFKTENWTEKYGLQAGIKCYNTAGIDNLYTQLEINAVRPFTYSHSSTLSSYTHLSHSLAHQNGSNFAEILFVANYNIKNWVIQFKALYTKAGNNNDTINYGRNPNLSYLTRFSDNNVNWLVGEKTKFTYFELLISKELFTNSIQLFTKFSVYSLQSNKVINSLSLSIGIKTPFYNRYNDWF